METGLLSRKNALEGVVTLKPVIRVKKRPYQLGLAVNKPQAALSSKGREK
jgi:hypothetical protein